MKEILKLINFLTIITIINASLVQMGLVEKPPIEKVIQQKCIRDRSHNYVGYTCSHMELKSIPTNLKSGFEIFDLSFNRIRDLDRNSFSRYTDVKFLYLFENMLQNIEPNTFSSLRELEAIDLSSNALLSIPMELFQLPLLRNLYASSNSLFELNKHLKTLEKPVKAPLQLINIADCKLEKVPNFGILPKLWHLNISSNPMQEILPFQFSPLCNLKSIDLNNTKMFPCSCQTITKYLFYRNITIQNWISCDFTISEIINCPTSINITEETTEFNECNNLRVIEILRDQSISTWIIIVSCLGGFLIIFIGFLYCLHRRNVKQTKKQIKLAKQNVKLEEKLNGGNKEVLVDTK